MNKNTYILLLIVALQFIVYTILNGFSVLSTDDIYTIHTTAENLRETINKALYFEQQAPLYFILMALWRNISASLIWAKLFHYLTFSISTVFFYKTLKLIVPKNNNIFILLTIFALHPFLFLISNDLRRYSLTLLFATITIYYFIKIYIHGDGKKQDHFLLILFSLAGVLNDYYHSFLLTALGFGILFTRGANKWTYFLSMVPPFIAFLILLKPLLYQLDSSNNWGAVDYISSNVFITALKYIIYLTETQTYLIHSFELNNIYNWFFRILFLGSIIIFINQEYLKKHMVLLIASSFLIIIYFIMISVLKSTDFLKVRYVGFSFPLFLFAFFILINQPMKNRYFRYVFMGYFSLAVFFSFSHIYQTKYSFQKSIKEIATKVENDCKDTPVFVMNPKYSEVIGYYLKNSSLQVIGIPGELDFNVYNYGSRCIESKEQLDIIFEPIIKNKTSFCIIINDGELKNDTYNSHVLYAYLNENFRLLARKEYKNFLICNYEHPDK